MPKPIPKQTENKELPNVERPTPDLPEELLLDKKIPDKELPEVSVPQQTPQNEEVPEETPQLEETPTETPKLEETPTETHPLEETPEPTPEKTELPSNLNERNCVVVGGNKIELKPTKLKYFRNKAASAYGLIKVVPIHEFLTYGKGVLDPERDADQLLYDFLVAAFDDPEFVKENYDEMDADIVEQVVRIFGRLNNIDIKEELARKNREAQAQAKR